MKVTGIDHIAINAVNFEEIVRFYRDIIGFKELNTVVLPDLDLVYLEIPGGGRIEIFDNRGATKKVSREDLDAGVRHIAFRVEDVPRHAEILRENGIEICLEVTDLPDLNSRVLLFYDPDGNVVEFCEPLKP